MTKKKKKAKKPQWIHLSPTGQCPIRFDNYYGIKQARIQGYPVKTKRIRFLAEYFRKAVLWLEDGEK